MTVSETPDILERLQEESMRLCGRSISRGDLDSGLASNLADAAIYEIERLRGLVDQLNFVVSSGLAQPRQPPPEIETLIAALQVASIEYPNSHDEVVVISVAMRDRLVAALSAGVAQCSKEPAAYLHTLHMELGQTQRKLMWTEPSPFGIPGKHYDATYTVSCTPLFALTDTSTLGNSK